MRELFKIPVKPRDTSLNAIRDLEWKELCFGDTRKLYHFFHDVLGIRAEAIAKEDRKKWATLSKVEVESYHKEASDIMFTLAPLPFNIHRLGTHRAMPLATSLFASEILRFRKHPADERTGMAGKYHFAALWHKTKNKIVGVSVLEKTDDLDEANFSCWRHPHFNSQVFLGAANDLMQWGKKTAGYQHFIAHTEKKTSNQRGNKEAVLEAKQLGFKIVGTRAPDAPNGNGRKAHILSARNWTPQAPSL